MIKQKKFVVFSSNGKIFNVVDSYEIENRMVSQIIQEQNLTEVLGLTTPYLQIPLSNSDFPTILCPQLMRYDYNGKYLLPKYYLTLMSNEDKDFVTFFVKVETVQRILFPDLSVKININEYADKKFSDVKKVIDSSLTYSHFNTEISLGNLSDDNIDFSTLLENAKNCNFLLKCSISTSEIGKIDEKRIILEDFYKSEDNYIESILPLVSYWHSCILNNDLMDFDDSSYIFDQFKSIIYSHSDFLNDLKERGIMFNSNVVDIFCDYLSIFSADIDYISCFNNIKSFLKEKNNDTKFHNSINELYKSKLNTSKFTLFELIKLPIERHSFYLSFLIKLKNVTPVFHIDSIYIDEAIKIVSEICDKISKNDKKTKSMSKLLNFQKKLGKSFKIIAPNRKIINSYKITIIEPNQCQGKLILFNNLILITTKKKNPLILFSRTLNDFRYVLDSNNSIIVYKSQKLEEEYLKIQFLNNDELNKITSKILKLQIKQCKKQGTFKKTIFFEKITNNLIMPHISSHEGLVLNDHLYCFGGHDHSEYNNLVIDLDLILNKTRTFNSIINDIQYHGIAGSGDIIYIFGGINSQNIINNNFYAFNTMKKEWSILNTINQPKGRYGHSFTCVNNNIYLFGGLNENDEVVSSLMVYNINTNRWESLDLFNEPEPRAFHSASIYSDNIVFFGGKGNNQIYSDIFFFNTSKRFWSKINIPGDRIKPRYYHRAAIVGNWLFVIGGTNEVELLEPFCAYLDKNKKKIFNLKSDGNDRKLFLNFILFCFNKHLYAYGGKPQETFNSSNLISKIRYPAILLDFENMIKSHQVMVNEIQIPSLSSVNKHVSRRKHSRKHKAKKMEVVKRVYPERKISTPVNNNELLNFEHNNSILSRRSDDIIFDYDVSIENNNYIDENQILNDPILEQAKLRKRKRHYSPLYKSKNDIKINYSSDMLLNVQKSQNDNLSLVQISPLSKISFNEILSENDSDSTLEKDQNLPPPLLTINIKEKQSNLPHQSIVNFSRKRNISITPAYRKNLDLNNPKIDHKSLPDPLKSLSIQDNKLHNNSFREDDHDSQCKKTENKKNIELESFQIENVYNETKEEENIVSSFNYDEESINENNDENLKNDSDNNNIKISSSTDSLLLTQSNNEFVSLQKNLNSSDEITQNHDENNLTNNTNILESEMQKSNSLFNIDSDISIETKSSLIRNSNLDKLNDSLQSNISSENISNENENNYDSLNYLTNSRISFELKNLIKEDSHSEIKLDLHKDNNYDSNGIEDEIDRLQKLLIVPECEVSNEGEKNKEEQISNNTNSSLITSLNSVSPVLLSLQKDELKIKKDENLTLTPMNSLKVYDSTTSTNDGNNTDVSKNSLKFDKSDNSTSNNNNKTTLNSLNKSSSFNLDNSESTGDKNASNSLNISDSSLDFPSDSTNSKISQIIENENNETKLPNISGDETKSKVIIKTNYQVQNRTRATSSILPSQDVKTRFNVVQPQVSFMRESLPINSTNISNLDVTNFLSSINIDISQFLPFQQRILTYKISKLIKIKENISNQGKIIKDLLKTKLEVVLSSEPITLYYKVRSIKNKTKKILCFSSRDNFSNIKETIKSSFNTINILIVFGNNRVQFSNDIHNFLLVELFNKLIPHIVVEID